MRKLFKLAAVTAIGMTMISTGPALAQSSTLTSELQRLQRDVTELQRQMFQNGGASTGQAAATVTAAPLPGDVAGRLQVRIQEMEEDLRRLNGRVEELDFQNRQLSQQLDKLSTDIELRFQALQGGGALVGQAGSNPFSANQVGVSSGLGTGQAIGNSLNSTIVIDSTTGQIANGAVVAEGGELQKGQKLFGQLTQTQLDNNSNLPAETNTTSVAVSNTAQQQASDQLATAPSAAPVSSAGQIQASAPTSAPVEGGATGLYKHAFGFLKQRDFASAEAVLNEFLTTYPEDGLAGNAMYWLGESHYARRQFNEAADVFVKAYTQYPESSKASHSLLKLGMTLNQLGEKDAACQVFGELNTKRPNAEARILKLGKSESQKLGCQ